MLAEPRSVGLPAFNAGFFPAPITGREVACSVAFSAANQSFPSGAEGPGLFAMAAKRLIQCSSCFAKSVIEAAEQRGSRSWIHKPRVSECLAFHQQSGRAVPVCRKSAALLNGGLNVLFRNGGESGHENVDQRCLCAGLFVYPAPPAVAAIPDVNVSSFWFAASEAVDGGSLASLMAGTTDQRAADAVGQGSYAMAAIAARTLQGGGSLLGERGNDSFEGSGHPGSARSQNRGFILQQSAYPKRRWLRSDGGTDGAEDFSESHARFHRVEDCGYGLKMILAHPMAGSVPVWGASSFPSRPTCRSAPNPRLCPLLRKEWQLSLAPPDARDHRPCSRGYP